MPYASKRQKRKRFPCSPHFPTAVAKYWWQGHCYLKSTQVLHFLICCFAGTPQEAEFILAEEVRALSGADSCAQDLLRMQSFVYTDKSTTTLGGEAAVAAGFLLQL